MDTHCLGVLDVGSNSIRLMVARLEAGQLRILHKNRATTRMISGVVEGCLTAEAIEQNAQVIAEFTREAYQAGANEVFAFGTSALRDAKNREVLSDRTEALCGVRVRLMSGEQEAQLAYSGCAPAGRCAVLDIGGGSSEVICGAEGKVLFAASAQMGAVRLMNRLGAQETDAEKMVAEAVRVIEPVVKPVRALTVDRWIGVGGTITTLAAMTWKVSKYTPDAIEQCPLTLEGVETWLDSLTHMSLEARRALPGLPAHRADVIPFGAAILAAEMRLNGAQVVYATDHDNLEGFIRQYLMNR